MVIKPFFVLSLLQLLIGNIAHRLNHLHNNNQHHHRGNHDNIIKILIPINQTHSAQASCANGTGHGRSGKHGDRGQGKPGNNGGDCFH